MAEMITEKNGISEPILRSTAEKWQSGLEITQFHKMARVTHFLNNTISQLFPTDTKF